RAACARPAGVLNLLVAVVTARDGERTAVVHELLQLLADLEEGETLGRNGDRLARARIAAVVRFVGTDREASEATNLNPFATLKRLRHRVEDAVDDELSSGLRQLAAARDCVDQLALRHVYSCGSCGLAIRKPCKARMLHGSRSTHFIGSGRADPKRRARPRRQ